jgi:hypothetical protein
MSHELAQWLAKIWPVLIDHTIEKAEAQLDLGEVKAYWAGTVLRIDIKPK